MVVIFSLILTFYCLMMLMLLIGWIIVRRKAVDVNGTVDQQKISISIVVAMRNESRNIDSIFHDLSSMAFPKERFEVIFVNDHSTDDTYAKALRLSTQVSNVIVLDLPAGVEGKKHALLMAIDHAKFDIIATTDADCRLSKNWLRCIAWSFQSEHIKMIIGPVKLVSDGSFFSRLQVTEFISLIGTSASAIGWDHPVMCNGANLSYRKNVFKEVSGYDGNLQIASGDDEFLMRKILRRYPSGISFLNFYEGVVSSNVQSNIEEFFNQRLRWAGKWKHNSDVLSRLLAVFVFLCQISFIAIIVRNIYFLDATILLILGKLFLEGIFLYWVGRFLERKFDALAFISLQFLYPFYVIIIGLLSLTSSYRWKSRNYK